MPKNSKHSSPDFRSDCTAETGRQFSGRCWSRRRSGIRSWGKCGGMGGIGGRKRRTIWRQRRSPRRCQDTRQAFELVLCRVPSDSRDAGDRNEIMSGEITPATQPQRIASCVADCRRHFTGGVRAFRARPAVQSTVGRERSIQRRQETRNCRFRGRASHRNGHG